jgi:hypothetical protein
MNTERRGTERMLQGALVTAGERLGIDCALPWVGELIEEAADGGLATGGPEEVTVRIRVEDTRDPFAIPGWRPLARGVLVHDRSLVLRNLLSTGFDLRLDVEDGTPLFTFRWRPAARERAVALALRSRFHLLARSALLRYPALWWAGTRGRAPLHASACTAGEGVALLAGPGGVGKSTLVSKELAAGGRATCDNLCVADGTSAWGVVEPLRVEGGGGRRMPHGRRETAMPGRVPVLAPDRVVVLERGSAASASVRPCDQQAAVRSLVTGTYMAQELRRYWAFAATLAAGTGIGPPHPPVAEVAATFAGRLPATLITLPSRPGPGLRELLAGVDQEVATWT